MYDEFLPAAVNIRTDNIDAKCIDSFPLAMSYVPMQRWGDLYSADVALSRGTVFSELDKPFLGRRALDD